MPSYVVTGANRCLGYAFVKHLASIEGNTVIAIARNKPATEERLAKDGVKDVSVFAADITDAKALKAAAEGTSQVTGGKLDYLISELTCEGGILQCLEHVLTFILYHRQRGSRIPQICVLSLIHI